MELNLKTVASSIIVGTSLVTGILAFDSRYATSKDVEKMEQKVVKTLEQFQTNMERKTLEQRYITLTDQMYQYKILIKKNPKDDELKEDYQKIEQERIEVKKKLEK